MVKLDHVKKQYSGFSLDCSLETNPGMITGLIGKNGSGKSTTFKAMLGLIALDGGTVEIFSKPVSQLDSKDKQRIGVAFADSGFSNYLTMKDIQAILKSTYVEFDEKFFQDKCCQFEIPMKKKLQEFSTGMKARVKVLATLCHNADLLILDEPTVGLDVIARDEVLDLIREYMKNHEQCSIMISSHISSDLENLCDDLYMIHDGSVILHEDTDVLLSDYAVIKVSEADYETLDKQYLIKTKKEPFGYCCLTDQKKFYLENYPKIVIQSGTIDDLIIMMNGGELR